ncbi:MAG: hypothetical protein ACREXR_02350, partial [Gammaproteobacteria bacterium]
WSGFWKKMYPRMRKTERRKFKRLKALVNKLYAEGKPVYNEQEQEKVYRQFRDEINTLTGRLSKLDSDPTFKARVGDEQHALDKQYQEFLQDALNANQHAVARGDIGTLSSETKEQDFLRAGASYRDESGKAAKDSVRRAMMGELGAEIAGKQGLLGTYDDIAQMERDRVKGAFDFSAGAQLQKEAARNAFRNQMDKLRIDMAGGYPTSKPNYYDLLQQYMAAGSGQPTPGRPSGFDRAQGAIGGIGDIITALQNFRGGSSTQQTNPYMGEFYGNTPYGQNIIGGSAFL